jgi:hypothetical protein
MPANNLRANIIKYSLISLLFIFLTVLTQIGGIIYLLSRLTNTYIAKKWPAKFKRRLAKTGSFLVLYLFGTLLIVPILAKPLGRVPLPITEHHYLRPANMLTCLLNRHYVRPELKEATLKIALEMNAKNPGMVVNYLDANFPFINGFPLFPHLSHNDGKKLDLAFCYKDAETGLPTNKVPSFIGYGICEEPLPGEEDKPSFCDSCGYKQYNMLRVLVPQYNKKNYLFDATRTTMLTQYYIDSPSIGKIFIEPHLKTRLHLTSDKVRFHGCRAVRHDDHLHVQLK